MKLTRENWDKIEELLWTELKQVEDPEIGLDIVALGLIYEVAYIDQEHLKVTMTFTSMACPYGPQLKSMVHAAATRILPEAEVDVEIVFSPPWDPHEMASEDAKMFMGIF